MPLLAPICLLPLHLAANVASPPPMAMPRAAAAAPTVCIEPGALARQDDLDGAYTETFATEHFLLAWDPANALVTEAAVATYADALETSWSVEIDTLGWLAPDQTDACLITVLLAEFDASWGDTGGYTDVKETHGVPYMALNTAWLEYGDDWTQTLVAHEFNHASQFAYDVFWEETDWWYWEATAEWVPDSVYDDANTYMWSLWAYLDAPHLALSSMTGTVQYGHMAFNQHLATTEGEDAPRAVWENAGPLSTMEEATTLALGGADFDEIVVAYTSRVAALDVHEPEVWLEAIGYFEIDPYVAHVDTYPAEGSISGREAPQSRGQNFLHLTAPAAGEPTGNVVFTFSGIPSVADVPTEWAVTLATTDLGGGVTHVSVRADASGAAELVIEGLGDDVSDAWIGVVPLGDIGEEHGAGWSWSALVEPDGADTGDDTGEDTGGDKETPKACACGTTSPVSGAWGLGIGVAALAGARRRRG
ncbi:MAG: DUF6055 domain-containing protein [Pseudomonadota bacterium]|nr:DUF6055 domain-containing protein [Pseudomonadota bacterium]